MQGSRKRLLKVLFIPDTHRPYHDKKAWRLMLQVAKAWRPDIVNVQGDFGDFYPVSDHNKDPNRARNLEYEINDINVGLDELDSLKAKRKIFVAGNHEYRLERYLMTKAPELFNMVKVADLFRLKRRGWEYVPYKFDTKIGKLYSTHDTGSAGRNAVFTNLSSYQHNVVTGHTHRLAYVIEGNAKGEAHLSASFGWLGDAGQIDYMHRIQKARFWSLGFGLGYLDEATGLVYVVPVPIIKYTCCVEGKVYRV